MRRTCFSTPCWGFRLTGGPAARAARPPNSHTEGDTKGSKKRIVPWFAPSRSRRLGAFFLIALDSSDLWTQLRKASGQQLKRPSCP